MLAQGSAHGDFPIIDSHIHLYPASHLSELNWTGALPTNHVLKRQNSVDEYRSATQGRPNLRGFVFLETDRKSGLSEHEWRGALDEVDFLVRIARGVPRSDEGHTPEDARLLLGIVPWAPVPAGAEILARYVKLVQQRCEEKWTVVKGFRYLVQDKPAGLMVQSQFIEGLQWLGNAGFTFDLGVDARSGGLHQPQEACEMMDRVYSDKNTLKIIINHLCKPNLQLTASEALGGHPDFDNWKRYVEKMASFNLTYMKLSGMFSELPPQDENSPADIASLVERTKPWADVVFKAFGPSRIMFGSDWPVCTVGGPGTEPSWSHWHALVGAVLKSQGLSPEEKARVWSGTAVEAYDIKTPCIIDQKQQ
ncbi:amidohydrolase [Exophiala viscosa]|uniref:amidohydrolase n=1 Tax=Exophiala viscosa TaxID=2486360 RepID=UPI0021948C1D|nr:amidohydrolase [Exophiala viscosa]